MLWSSAQNKLQENNLEGRSRTFLMVRSRCFLGEKEESDDDSLSMKSTYRRQPIRGYNEYKKKQVCWTPHLEVREKMHCNITFWGRL
jgi:hypothetical protein